MRRIGGLIQAAFAAFWLVRGSLVIGGRAADRPDRGVRRRGDRRVLLCDQGHGWHCPAAQQCGGQADRASRHDRHDHRVRRGVCPPGHRHRRRPLRLGAAVDRDHDRTAAAVAGSRRPHPALSAGRMGANCRTADPRRHLVGHRTHRHHRHRCRRCSCWAPRWPASTTSREPGAKPSRRSSATSPSRRAPERGYERRWTTGGVRGRAGRTCPVRPLVCARSGGARRSRGSARRDSPTRWIGRRPTRATQRPRPMRRGAQP